MTYYVSVPVTYTAAPATPGYVAGDHTVSWSFDDGTVGSGASVSKTWASAAAHVATVTATNNTTGGSNTATKSVTVLEYPPSLTALKARDVILSSDGNTAVVSVNNTTYPEFETYMTTDQGINFSFVRINASGISLYGGSTDLTYLVGGPTQQLWFSSSYGLNWDSTLTPPGTSLMACVSRNSVTYYTILYLGNASLVKHTAAGVVTTLLTVGSGQWFPTSQSDQTVACSADGQVIIAAMGSATPSYTGYLRLSVDGGTTMTSVTSLGLLAWQKVCISDSGAKIYAIQGSTSTIYYSLDSGATWNTSTAPHNRIIKCSGDGTKLFVVGYQLGVGSSSDALKVSVSTDNGATWTSHLVPAVPGDAIICFVTSYDGNTLYLIASALGTEGDLWMSNDGGATWTQRMG